MVHSGNKDGENIEFALEETGNSSTESNIEAICLSEMTDQNKSRYENSIKINTGIVYWFCKSNLMDSALSGNNTAFWHEI